MAPGCGVIVKRMPAPPSPADVDAQLARAVEAFVQTYGEPPTHAAVAPGRVNLIGEHVDYCDGLVLPLAIQRQTVVVGIPGGGDGLRIGSTRFEDTVDLPADTSEPLPAGRDAWANYVLGAWVQGVDAGLVPRGAGARLLLDSTVPSGGGLSSSASLEVGTLTLMEAMAAERTGAGPLNPVDKALRAQAAEHRYAGTPCGIMDQFISAMGEAGHALLIDCRDRTAVPVPLDPVRVRVLVVNSMAPHELNGGEYAERRGQTSAAAAALGVDSLRDAPITVLAEAEAELEPVIFRRARHVIHEIQRTALVASALRSGATPAMLTRVGGWMFESHASLRDDFEVSTPELDLLVKLAAERQDRGVFGSRMTGGGFGGCTVTLVEPEQADEVAEGICRDYLQQTGIRPEAFVTEAADGARVLRV